MIPVLTEEQPIHYVGESDMITFISKNSNMGWDKICDFVRDNGICNSSGEPILWSKEDIIDTKQHKHYNDAQIKWVTAFFEAHPWVKNIMIIFD